MEQVFLDDRALMFTDDTDPRMPGAVNLKYESVESAVEYALGAFRQTDRNAQVCVDCSGHNAHEIFARFCRQIGIVEASGGLVGTLNPETGGKEYLYIYRNRMWDLPKGKREPGESREDNAFREVWEETGVEGLRIVRFLQNTYHFIGGNPMAPPPNNGPIHVKQTAWYEMETDEKQVLKPQGEEGIEEAVWLDRHRILDKLPEMYASIAYLSNNFFEV